MNRTGRRAARFRIPSERGGINWLTVVLLVLLVVAVYAAYKFIPVYSTDYGFKSILEAESNNAYTNDDETIRRHILREAKARGINLEEGSFSVYRQEKTIFIKLKYRQVVDLPFSLDRVIEFSHDIQKEIRQTL